MIWLLSLSDHTVKKGCGWKRNSIIQPTIIRIMRGYLVTVNRIGRKKLKRRTIKLHFNNHILIDK